MFCFYFFCLFVRRNVFYSFRYLKNCNCFKKKQKTQKHFLTRNCKKYILVANTLLFAIYRHLAIHYFVNIWWIYKIQRKALEDFLICAGYVPEKSVVVVFTGKLSRLCFGKSKNDLPKVKQRKILENAFTGKTIVDADNEEKEAAIKFPQQQQQKNL